MPSDPLPAGGSIDPFACPRGHHAVELYTNKFRCHTCYGQGRETTSWDRSELVDLREDEPPLADGRRVATDGGQPSSGTVPPENYELWDSEKEKYTCPFCDGRILRVGKTAECTECGERFRYEGPATDSDDDLRTDGGQPADDVHRLRPETVANLPDGALETLEILCEAGGEATFGDLLEDGPEYHTMALGQHINDLFEVDIVHYDLAEPVEDSEIELAHDTIRVQPLVLDGERPSTRDMLVESGIDVPEGVLEDAE